MLDHHVSEIGGPLLRCPCDKRPTTVFGVFIGALDCWKLPGSYLADEWASGGLPYHHFGVYVYGHPGVDRLYGILGIDSGSFKDYILSTPEWLYVIHLHGSFQKSGAQNSPIIVGLFL